MRHHTNAYCGIRGHRTRRWLAALLVAAVSLLMTWAPALADDTITVRPGDTLFSIAARNGTSVDELDQANGLADRRILWPGMKLRAPQRFASEIRESQDTAASSTSSFERSQDDASSIGGGYGGPRSIVIDVSEQSLTAFEGAAPVRRFVVSTGTAYTPTPIGRFQVYNRLTSQRMVGPTWDLPGVPWVQYFTGAYAIHGAYWHTDFGIPVSHGCVNLKLADAEWLFGWAEYGTEVVVQP